MGQNPNERIPKNRSTPQETVRGVQMGGAPVNCAKIYTLLYTLIAKAGGLPIERLACTGQVHHYHRVYMIKIRARAVLKTFDVQNKYHRW